MKGMIFAAGLGTRLRPLTNDRPKALVEVCGKPMLQWVIEKFRDAGITEIVVNVHHFADKIIDFLRENDSFRCDIHISDERSLLLDTGGGILKAREWLGDSPFVVHNADILTDFPLAEMIEAHENSDAIATLLVADRRSSRYLLFDPGLQMRGWENIKTGETRPEEIDASSFRRLAFGGVHVLSPEVFDSLSQFSTEPVFSIIPFYVGLSQRAKIQGYIPSKPYQWFDIGSPEKLRDAEEKFHR